MNKKLKEELIKGFTEMVNKRNIVDYSISTERKVVEYYSPDGFTKYRPDRTIIDIQIIYKGE